MKRRSAHRAETLADQMLYATLGSSYIGDSFYCGVLLIGAGDELQAQFLSLSEVDLVLLRLLLTLLT